MVHQRKNTHAASLATTAARWGALLWAPFVYAEIGNDRLQALLLAPLILLGSPQFLYLVLGLSLLVILGEYALPRYSVPLAALSIQTVAVVWLFGRSNLLAASTAGTWRNRYYARWGISTRRLLGGGAAALALLLFFRSTPVLPYALWCLNFLFFSLSLPAPEKTSWKSGVATAGLTLMSTAFSLAVLELGARALLPPVSAGHDLYEPHPRYDFTLRPGGRGNYALRNNDGEWFTVAAEISSQGVRDREYGPKAPDEFRILMIGDSYTMGHGLPFDQTIPKQVELRLASSSVPRRVSVINGGVGGYSPWHEFGFLRERGFLFEPDLVVLQVFPSNDVPGSLRRTGKLLMTPDIQWERRLDFFKRQNELPSRCERWMQSRSRAYAALLPFAWSSNPIADILNDFRFLPRRDYVRVVTRAFRNPYREVSLIEFYPELVEAWDLFARDIRDIAQICRQRGVDMLAYCHPFPFGVLEDTWMEWDSENAGVVFEINKDIRLTEAIFAGAGIPSIPVTSALEAYPRQRDLYYIYDGHFTPKGAEIVAECIYDYLTSEYPPLSSDGSAAP
ncbi:MAG: hypothetical protein AMXMBFR4_04200 [Candidatus Hydrogenedentota bacterium]